MKSLVFISGQDNKEFWELLDKLRTEGKGLKSEWQGDFYVTEYQLGDKKYIYEEDMDLGIPYKITEVE